MLQCRKDIRIVTKVGGGLGAPPYEEQLRSLGLLSLEKRMPKGDPIPACTFLKKAVRRRGCLLWLVSSSRAGGHGMKLCQGKHRLDERKMFFTLRVVGYWNKLPRKVVTAPNLPEFREHLASVLSHTV